MANCIDFTIQVANRRDFVGATTILTVTGNTGHSQYQEFIIPNAQANPTAAYAQLRCTATTNTAGYLHIFELRFYKLLKFCDAANPGCSLSTPQIIAPVVDSACCYGGTYSGTAGMQICVDPMFDNNPENPPSVSMASCGYPYVRLKVRRACPCIVATSICPLVAGWNCAAALLLATLWPRLTASLPALGCLGTTASGLPLHWRLRQRRCESHTVANHGLHTVGAMHRLGRYAPLPASSLGVNACRAACDAAMASTRPGARTDWNVAHLPQGHNSRSLRCSRDRAIRGRGQPWAPV